MASSLHHEGLCKGFNAITVAGAFIAAIQGQLMSTTLASPETVAFRAVNAFFLAGLVLDVLAALLAFLTTRWFERLTEGERRHLEAVFSQKQNNPQATRQWKTGSFQWFFYTWLGISLFIPMQLLILGIVCMMGGIYTYVWTQHSVIVASFNGYLGGRRTAPVHLW